MVVYLSETIILSEEPKRFDQAAPICASQGGGRDPKNLNGLLTWVATDELSLQAEIGDSVQVFVTTGWARTMGHPCEVN